MHRQIGVVLALAAALAIAAPTGSDAASRPWKLPKFLRSPARVPSFTVSGEFTGELGGTVVLNGNTFQLTPGATLYELGRGVLPAGSFLNARRVTFSGVTRGDAKIVRSVIVRPESIVGTAAAEPSRNVGILDENAPQ